jgi:hypothetical protein
MIDKLAVGRPPREVVLDREGIPAPVMIALEARAAGNSWKQSAEIGRINAGSLREWRRHPVVRDTLNEMVRDKLAGATAKLVDATPRLAEELIALAMDSRNKPYSRVNAMALVFQTVATHLIDQSQQEQLAELKLQLDKLENGGPVLDV